MDPSLRPMSASEILDKTFSLYRNNLLLFIGIALLPAALSLALHFVGIAAHITVPVRGRSFQQTQFMFLGFELLVLFITFAIGGGIATGATVFAVYGVQLKRPATIGAAYRNVVANWLEVIWAATQVFLLTALWLVLGAVAFIVAVVMPFSGRNPAVVLVQVIVMVVLVLSFWVYLVARYALVIPSLVLDRTSVSGAFQRCRFLSRGALGRIFLVVLLTSVLAYALSWAFQAPLLMIWGPRGHPLLTRVWTDVGQFFSRLLAGPIGTVSVALIYIDQRIRKEAFDLQIMMEALQETSDHAHAVQSAE